jgi:hypothetical protein
LSEQNVMCYVIWRILFYCGFPIARLRVLFFAHLYCFLVQRLILTPSSLNTPINFRTHTHIHSLRKYQK